VILLPLVSEKTRLNLSFMLLNWIEAIVISGFIEFFSFFNIFLKIVEAVMILKDFSIIFHLNG